MPSAREKGTKVKNLDVQNAELPFQMKENCRSIQVDGIVERVHHSQ